MPLNTAAPVLCVTDLAAAVSYYAQAFGFERLRYFDGNDSYAVLGLGSAQVHLMAARSANPNHHSSAHVADCFVWIDNVTQVVSRADAAGCPAERGPEHYDSRPVATTEVVYADLDGNWICFGQID